MSQTSGPRDPEPGPAEESGGDSPDGVTFPSWRRGTPDLPGHVRDELFRFLPAEEQDGAWKHLAERERLRIESELELESRMVEPWCPDCHGRDHDEPPCPPRHRPQRSTAATWQNPSSVELRNSTDPLKTIAPREYVELLIGVAVPPSGLMRCPFPGHEDRNPSFRVYSDHTHCFSCGRGGGDIYGFGGALYDLDPRRDFLELRRRLAAALGGAYA